MYPKTIQGLLCVGGWQQHTDTQSKNYVLSCQTSKSLFSSCRMPSDSFLLAAYRAESVGCKRVKRLEAKQTRRRRTNGCRATSTQAQGTRFTDGLCRFWHRKRFTNCATFPAVKAFWKAISNGYLRTLCSVCGVVSSRRRRAGPSFFVRSR